MKTMCIYHANCADGFTAAWVVWKALGKDVEFVPGFYGNEPPDVEGKTVYMVDFSYKRPIMGQLVKKAKKLVHIDHHLSAIKDMERFGAPNLESFYSKDNSQSGAMLTWNYFYSEEEIPNIIKYVDDVDRWIFALPHSKEVQANMFSYEYTFENWEFLYNQSMKDQIAEGTAIQRRLMKDCKELSAVVVRRMNIGGYNVPIANVPKQFGSYLAHDLAVGEPFAGYYYDTTEREFGLRSEEGGIDVSKIAEGYGGGGHKHASGFKVTYKRAEDFEV
jgi:oligoribonuclease NrnB/cAMP/cGMP phosphodiesterase (DHH superfamily)